MNYDYCSGRLHTIQKGDTLYKISGMYQVPLALILRANPYVDIYNLQPGEKLCIPGGFDNETNPPKPQIPAIPPKPQTPAAPSMPEFRYVIRQPQSMQSILDKFGITLEKFLEANPPDTIILHEGTSLEIPDYAVPQDEES